MQAVNLYTYKWRIDIAVNNPSELARLYDELEFYKATVKNLSLPKSTRELALTAVRDIERKLGLESRDYNGG